MSWDDHLDRQIMANVTVRDETDRERAEAWADLALDQYLETALWSSTDPDTNGDPLDREFGTGDIDDESQAKARETLADFFLDCLSMPVGKGERLAELLESDPEQAGHDLWLTQNGHGAGFWDGDWPDWAGAILTERAQLQGESDLYPHGEPGERSLSLS